MDILTQNIHELSYWLNDLIEKPRGIGTLKVIQKQMKS